MSRFWENRAPVRDGRVGFLCGVVGLAGMLACSNAVNRSEGSGGASTPAPIEIPADFSGMEKRSVQLQNDVGAPVVVEARVADAPVEQMAGFQNVPEEVARGEAILFLFQQDSVAPFHMRNVKIALDILFFDARGYAVSNQRMEPDPDRLWSAGSPYRFVLELPAGRAEELRLGATSRLSVPIN
ncbi:MAG: DUF192 domain-containing protein [Nitrospirae bacterium]|nr:DUF192 domain-containing protein [Nitrospirota bacterium]